MHKDIKDLTVSSISTVKPHDREEEEEQEEEEEERGWGYLGE